MARIEKNLLNYLETDPDAKVYGYNFSWGIGLHLMLPRLLEMLEPGSDDVQEVLYDRTLDDCEKACELWELIENILPNGFYLATHPSDGSDCFIVHESMEWEG